MMKLYLIRHAETVHNVGQAWAGTTDSPLTNHGVLQIERLARYFRSVETLVEFSHVFASDLKRAMLTAEGICEQQQSRPMVPVVTPLLREQHFGSREGVSFRQAMMTGSAAMASEPEPELEPAETEEQMHARANTFLEEYLFPILLSPDDQRQSQSRGHDDGRDKNEKTIAIVAHGIILRVLWDCLVHAFPAQSVRCGTPEVQARVDRGGGGMLMPFWSNTGFMEVSIHRHNSPVSLLPDTMVGIDSSSSPPVMSQQSPLSGCSITVHSIDNRTHLRDLRRTGGGIGSSKHDAKQRRIESYFSH